MMQIKTHRNSVLDTRAPNQLYEGTSKYLAVNLRRISTHRYALLLRIRFTRWVLEILAF